MRGVVWLFVLVFIVGVIYPPAAAAIAGAAMTAAFVVWFVLWLGSRGE
jgi:K+-transporting ATPase c subunit